MRWWRGRTRAEGADAGLGRCGACGTKVHVDAEGRCPLGHRAGAASAGPRHAGTAGSGVPVPPRNVAADQDRLAPASELPAAPAAPAAGAADGNRAGSEALAELLAWDDAAPSASALDVDGAALPTAAQRPEPAPAHRAVVEPEDDDEVSDATYARRRVAGIVGGTTLGLLAVLGAVVALPI